MLAGGIALAGRLLVVCLALGASTRSVYAQRVTARVAGELTGFVGGRLEVPVVVDLTEAGGVKLGRYSARLSWNPAVLRMTACWPWYCPDVLLGTFPFPSLNADSVGLGVLRFTAGSQAGVGGKVTLLRIKFSIRDTSSSELGLQFSEMFDASTPAADLLPQLTVFGGTFCAARGLWGDVDRNGRANSRDALAILTRVVGLTVNPDSFDLSLGDVDGDAKADSRDALIILSYGVGLEIPGQRVLLPVPRSCSTGTARQVSLFPAAATLTLKQTLQLVVQAVDSLGRAVAVGEVTWRSSNPLVAGVGPLGLVSPRSPGSATITAEVAPGLRASATVTVIPQRWNWYVDVRAKGAPLQLGTAAEPFEHPLQALSVVEEGDTIRVAQGVYEFDYEFDYGQGPGTGLRVGAVILGGTPGDTATRPIFRAVSPYATGLRLEGGTRTVIRNLVFENFDRAIDVAGVSTFVLEDSRLVLPRNDDYYVTGISHGPYCGAATDTVRVERSVFLGGGAIGYYAISYYQGCPPVGVTMIQNSRFSRVSGAFLPDGGVHVVRGNTVDSAMTGFYVSGDSVVASDNLLTRIVEEGIVVSAPPAGLSSTSRGRSSVLRNRITCTASSSHHRALHLEGHGFLAEADTVENCHVGVSIAAVKSGTVIRKTIVRNPVHGVQVDQPDSATVRLEENAIAGADTAAVLLLRGRIRLFRNNIRNNDYDGLRIPSSTGYVTVADSNAFVGNARYAVYAPSDSVDARNNWWGAATGPGSGAGADSVLGARVVTSPFLTAEPPGLLQPGPERATGGMAAPAGVRAVPVGRMVGVDATRTEQTTKTEQTTTGVERRPRR
jgi:hypothetical protein